jgi:hypothetical protein
MQGAEQSHAGACLLLILQGSGTSMVPGRGTAVLNAISAAAQAAVNVQQHHQLQQQQQQQQHAVNMRPVLSYQAQPPYAPQLPVQRPRVPLPEVRYDLIVRS